MDDDIATGTVERRVRREQTARPLRWIARSRSLAAVLDLLWQPIALLLLGEPIRAWHAKATARHRLSSHPELRIRDGLLVASHTCAATRAGTSAAADSSSRKELSVATVQILDFGANADLPVSAVVMLELRDPVSAERSLQRLSGEFHLTRKEAETAPGLYTMGSVDELARCIPCARSSKRRCTRPARTPKRAWSPWRLTG